jgi:hypothetical protein
MKLKWEKSVISLCCLLQADLYTGNPYRVGYQLLIDRSLAWLKFIRVFLNLLCDFISRVVSRRGQGIVAKGM